MARILYSSRIHCHVMLPPFHSGGGLSPHALNPGHRVLIHPADCDGSEARL